MDVRRGVALTRVELSIGGLDLVQFRRYGHAFPRHAHEHFTFGVFDTRNGRLYHRGGWWPAADGSILAVAPDEVHAAEPGDEGWTYRAFYPGTAIVDVALERDDGARSTPVSFSQPVVEDRRLATALLAVHQLLLSRRDLYAEESLLRTLRELVERHASRPTISARRAAAPAVQRARDYLEAHFAEPVKLARLAEASGLSPFHLSRSFAEVVGIPPHAYLTQVRARRAREMLRRGDALTSVAYACGFCDQSHLTRTFKQIFGVTPGAYLDALRPRHRIA